jgi:DNA transformation protein and related proteins
MPSKRPGPARAPAVARPLPEQVAHAAELLAVHGPVRCRRMFGGWGLYVGELFVAIIAFDRLYLKAATGDEAAYRAAGGAPFVYDGKHRPMQLRYWTPPVDALDSPEAMAPWARRALAAALSATVPARASRPKPASKAPPASSRPKRRTAG